MDAITAAVGNAGKLWLYGGTQPAGPDTTHAQTLLVSFTLGSPFAPASSGSPAELLPTPAGTANAVSGGDATWWRVTTSAGVDGGAGLIDGSAGLSGCDMTTGGTIVSGAPVTMS